MNGSTRDADLYYLGAKTLSIPGTEKHASKMSHRVLVERQEHNTTIKTERIRKTRDLQRRNYQNNRNQEIMTDQLIMNATMVRQRGRQRTGCVLSKTVLADRPHSVVAPVSVSLFDGHRSVTRASRQRRSKPPAGQRGCGSETQLSEKAHRPRGGVPR